MSLEQFRQNGWLVRHTPAAQEVQDLFDIALRDLADSRVRGLSTDTRFSLAYNAALQLSTAALHAAGYSPAKGNSHHLRAIQSLRFTIGADVATIDQLEVFRTKRHKGLYDRAGAVSDVEADAMGRLAEELLRTVSAWLDRHHPALAPIRRR